MQVEKVFAKFGSDGKLLSGKASSFSLATSPLINSPRPHKNVPLNMVSQLSGATWLGSFARRPKLS